MQGQSTQGDLRVGQHVVFEASHMHDCLAVEWLGSTCYPVVHCESPDATPKTPSFHEHAGPERAPQTVQTGPTYADRRVYAVLAMEGSTTSEFLQYGHTVRLQNVFSHLYLSSKDSDGEVEVVLEHPRGVRDLVDETGVRRDLWKLLPRHKVREDGERIRKNDQLFIVNVACGLYLHLSSMKSSALETWCTMNDEALRLRSIAAPTRMLASFQGTDSRGAAWTIGPYEDETSPHAVIPPKNSLRCLDMIVIFHKEMEGFLKVTNVNKQGVGEVCLSLCKVDKSTYNVLDLAPTTSSLFMIEGEDSSKGGGIEYKKRRYRLKHLATEAYLAVSIVKGELGKTSVSVTTTADASDPHTMISFQPLDNDNTESCVTRQGFSRILFVESQLYLHGLYENNSGDATSMASPAAAVGTNGRGTASVTAVSKGYFEDVFAVRVLKPSLRADLLSFIAPANVLESFIQHWSKRKVAVAASEDWRGRKRIVDINLREVALEERICAETAKYLQKLIRSISNVPSSTDVNVVDDPLPPPSYQLQRMLFEHGIDDLLFATLQTPLQQGGQCLEDITKQTGVMLTIYKVGFRLVEQMIRGAKDLAVRLAKFIPFLETQLKHELNIASALMQIVADNKDILLSLNQRQLESFCFLVPQYGRNPTYLTLLSACCVCEGEAVPQNQDAIGQCLSGIIVEPTNTPQAIDDATGLTATTLPTNSLTYIKPCSLSSMRVFYPIVVHAIDGLHIKPYNTFPPSTERKVRRFLLRYEADRRARQDGLLAGDCDISSSESSLSSADSDGEEDMPFADEDIDSDYEEEVAVQQRLGAHDDLWSPSHQSIRSFLYRGKKPSQGSWSNYVAVTSQSSVQAASGCWVWRCELPAVAPQWRKQWFALVSGYLTFKKQKRGRTLRSIPVVEISLVYKDNVEVANPPGAVRNFGLVCEFHPSKTDGSVRRLLICAECIGERNELLHVLRTEVRQAEAAIEGTKALSGDPVFATRVGTHEKKTASLLSHMKTLLKRHHATRGDAEEEAGDKVTRVTTGTRFDTQWQSLSNFIKHRSLQNVHYLEAQLTLWSRLCHGGNTLALNWLQSFMTREVIQEGLQLSLEHPLAPLIRAAFADLAITVYLEPAKNSPDAYSQKHRAFLSQLKTVVDEHLRRPHQKKAGQKGEQSIFNEHKFTASVLRMCNKLIAAGSYSSSELTLLLPPLVKVLSRYAPQTATKVEVSNDLLGILQPRQQATPQAYYKRDRMDATIPELQMRVMDTKLEACNVLMRLFSDTKTYRLMSALFTPIHKDGLDQLTTALLSTVLHTGHDPLYLTAVRLLFRNLSTCVGDDCETDAESHTRLAVILQRRLDEGKPEVLLALFRLIDGALSDALLETATSTTLAVMKTLMRMIYLSKEIPHRMLKVQTDLDSLGLAPLVAVMIEAKDERVVYHSLTLMIALMHGGNAVVQESLSHYFLSRNDEALFVTLRNRISSAVYLIKECGAQGAERLQLLRNCNLHHIREVLRVLQLFAEGHNIDMQDYLRHQADNVMSYNLVKESFSFLCVILTMDRHSSFTQSIVVQAFDSLTEYCQGPCKGNQIQLIKGNITSQVTGALSRQFDGLAKLQVNEVRSAAVLCLHAVLEGVTNTDQLSISVQRTLDTGVLRKVLEEAWSDKQNETSLEVAFNVFILLKMLKMANTLADTRGFAFLDTMTGGIEICRDGRLERVFFRIPSISANLSSETKEDLLRSVDRSTPTARISDFYYRAEGLIFEIEYFQRIFHEPKSTRVAEILRTVQQLLHNWNSTWHTLMIGTAFLANILLLIFAVYGPAEEGDVPRDWTMQIPGLLQLLLQCIAVVQMALATCLLSDFLLSKAPLVAFTDNKKSRMEAMRKANQRLSNSQMTAWWDSAESTDPGAQPPTNLRSDKVAASAASASGSASGKDQAAEEESDLHGTDISRVLSDESYSVMAMMWRFRTDVRLVFYGACLLTALMALGDSPVYLSFHLLAVTGRSPVLVNVITAVTRHSRALLLTALLGSVVVYLFTVMAFTLFRDKFGPEVEGDDAAACDSLRGCFRYLLVNAVRAGGGVGDLIQDHSWYDRPYMLFGLLSDFLFFVIIIVILLNIISGVIIDTFARLREERQVVEDDIRSRCFICGIESTQFDRQGEGFDSHIKNDHNLWYYIYFLHHLLKKDVAELTGPESYVYKMIQKQDLGYFPLNKAIVLEGKREEEDRLLYIANDDRQLQDKLVDIETKLSQVHQVWRKSHQEQKQDVSQLCESAVRTVVDAHKATEDVPDEAQPPSSPPPSNRPPPLSGGHKIALNSSTKSPGRGTPRGLLTPLTASRANSSMKRAPNLESSARRLSFASPRTPLLSPRTPLKSPKTPSGAKSGTWG